MGVEDNKMSTGMSRSFKNRICIYFCFDNKIDYYNLKKCFAEDNFCCCFLFKGERDCKQSNKRRLGCVVSEINYLEVMLMEGEMHKIYLIFFFGSCVIHKKQNVVNVATEIVKKGHFIGRLGKLSNLARSLDEGQTFIS